MIKGKLTRLFRDPSGAARWNFFAKHFARFTLILGAGLFADYLRELARPCQFLTTLYNLLYCPLIMYIYAEHDEISFFQHAWSPDSLLVVVFAAIGMTLWAAMESKPRSQ
jgi:hypothetical protein